MIVKEAISNYYNLDDDTRIDIDNAIGNLVRVDTISNKEIFIIELMKLGYSVKQMSLKTGMREGSLHRVINRVCNKISVYLGEGYNNDKLYELVELKLGRELTREELDFCKKIISHSRLIKGSNIYNFKEDNG
jgi:hypothetical protein